ncbi:MAG: PDZ domain-containing protein, partial [Rubripirellula sp.]|nr:PDZ domain-containing protein [Rubripirellula sp.]
MILSIYSSRFAGLLLLGFILLLISVVPADKAAAQELSGEEQSGEVTVATASKDTAAYWITQLSHEHYLRREKASQKIKQLGPAVIPDLVTAMNQGDLEVLERSVAVISEFAISLEPADDGNAWITLKNMAENSVGRRALAAKAAMDEVAESRSERAEGLLVAAGLFIGDGDFSVAASQRLLPLVEVGDGWNGDVKVLRWLEWAGGIGHVRISGKAIQGGVLRNVARMPDLTAIAIVNSDAAVDDEVFSSLSDMERIESLDIRYVNLSEQQGEIISRLPLRTSLTLMGTNITSAAVEKIRSRLPGLEIQFRQGGFLGVSCYPEERECRVNMVYPNTAAADAGLMFRDIIIGAGENEISDFSTLQKTINKYQAGDEIEIRFLRGGK